ncbi:putative diguanylate cyclase DgcQ [bioreactor metagenome]|uniref:Putative diguanylate cyclase DgcQ n=1 Tax=bioreactor metagenome TaxID=1076179 RepID=A0A645JN06_9ZZZZ
MMDLDKFKSINDTYGHDTGDRVLVAFAELLTGTLRHEDAIARLGGDEFVALLPGIAKREATEIANRILRSAEAQSVSCGAKCDIPLVVSIGICDNASAASADAMLKAADQAMYQAKNGSGNCCVEWSL